jgi:prepilin-type N-terminal cleavage/methylation domain-containing protein
VKGTHDGGWRTRFGAVACRGRDSDARPGPSGEDGLTLVELLVAMTIFTMVALSLAYTLQSALITTRDARDRVQAANLAARELEIVRNDFGATTTGPATLTATSTVTNPHPLPGGTAGQPLHLDGTDFTVVRHVEWLPAGTGSSPCDGGTAVNYPSVGVNVQVTWNAMHGTNPVQSNTVLTPPKGTLNTTMAFVAVKILGAGGTGLNGVPVTLSGPGGSPVVTSAADGCAVFSLTTMGTYSATIGTAGYVTFDGQAGATKTGITVTAGTLQQVNFSYDQAATLTAAFTTDGVHRLPSPLPGLTYFNQGLVPLGNRAAATAATSTTLGPLWPFSDGYSVWAGTCRQSDPTTTGHSRPAPVVVLPGASGSVSLTLAPLSVLVTTMADVPLVGYTVFATPADTTGCTTPVATLTLGTTDSSGKVLSSLPGGVWNLSVKDALGAAKTLDGGVLVGGVSTVVTPALTVTDPETVMSVRVP